MKNTAMFLIFSLFSILSVSAQNTYVDVFNGPKTVVLDGSIKDIDLDCGVAKSAVPVALPKGTKGFYYRITILPKRKKFKIEQTLLNTIEEMPAHIQDPQIADHLTALQSGRKANFYLIQGRKNANGLENLGHFEHFNYFIGHKSFCGYMENNKLDDFYIGIENRYNWKGVKVILEVVAVQEAAIPNTCILHQEKI